MGNVVEINEVSQTVFDNDIWSASNEKYWYMYAWEILGRAGMTKYNTEMERKNIFIYALTLKVTYNEFCEAAFEEYGYNDDLFSLVDSCLNEFEIGQMVAPLLENGESMDNVEDGLWQLVSKNKNAVYSALLKELNKSEIFAFMYCTNGGITVEKYDEEENEWYDEGISAHCLEDYKKQVKDNMDKIVNEGTIDKMAGFEFIENLG